MTCLCVEYPALIYKNNRNNLFVANCFIKNLVGMGKTELEAIQNLEKSLTTIQSDYMVKIKPMYELKMSLG